MALMCASRSRDRLSRETLFLCSILKGNVHSDEIGVDILAGNIVWVNGPYAAGKYPDIEIFCSGLAH